MRSIINYFRQCLCKHEFEFDEILCHSEGDSLLGGGYRNKPMISMLCKKCGYHKSYWKFKTR